MSVEYPDKLVKANIAREFLEDLQGFIIEEYRCAGCITVNACNGDNWRCPFLRSSRSGFDCWCTLEDAIDSLQEYVNKGEKELGYVE